MSAGKSTGKRRSLRDDTAGLAAASTALALSLIGRISHCGGLICSGCHQTAYSPKVAIHHNPACLVGRVLDAVRACEPAEPKGKRGRA